MTSTSSTLSSSRREQIYGPLSVVRPDISWDRVSQLPDLHEGKSILITGAAKGLGKEIAWWTSVFGGANVMFCDVDEKSGSNVEQEFTAQIERIKGCGKAQFVKLDVTDAAACRQLHERALEQFGKIDVVINNAGIGTADTALTADFLRFKQIQDVNLGGFVHMTQPFLEYVAAGRKSESIRAEERKKLITICSIGGMIGLLDRFSYATSKFALAGAINSVAVDHGDIVEVIGINPGRIATDMPLARIAQAPEQERELVSWMMASTQRNGQMLDPRQIAGFISFAASDDPGTIPLRNTHISMDDGWTLGHQPNINSIPLHLLRLLLEMREKQN